MLFSFTKSFFPAKFERLTHGIIGTVAALLITWLFLYFDKKTFTEAGLKPGKKTLKNFLLGTFLGIIIMGSFSLGVILFSGFKLATNTNSGIFNFFLSTLPLIPLAFLEEVAFRAYPLVTGKEKLGIRPAIIITSVLFALYHIANGWTLSNAFMGAGVWGIVFAAAAIYSNGIAMPTGMHYAANLTTAAFGISNNSFNIWTLKQYNGLSLENYESSWLATLVPQITLLIIGIISMEWLVKRHTNRKFSP